MKGWSNSATPCIHSSVVCDFEGRFIARPIKPMHIQWERNQIPIVLNWKIPIVQSIALNSYANLSRLFKDLKQIQHRSEREDVNIKLELQTESPKGKLEIIDELEKLLNIVSGKTKKNPNLGPCITPECRSHYGMVWEELHPKR
ncbi:hypothetical protein TNCV_2778331 [Trichonephila clavipes]|nr:hypothetical protein TNCV_2778331 [Trichonephila clavipes]